MDLSNAEWRKSKRSSDNGGDCVETVVVEAAWRTSTHSSDNGGNCVEVVVIDAE